LADRRNLIDNCGTKTCRGGKRRKKGKQKRRMIHELAKLFGDQFCGGAKGTEIMWQTDYV